MTRTVEVSKCQSCVFCALCDSFLDLRQAGNVDPSTPLNWTIPTCQASHDPTAPTFHHWLHTFCQILWHFIRFFPFLDMLLLTFHCLRLPTGDTSSWRTTLREHRRVFVNTESTTLHRIFAWKRYMAWATALQFQWDFCFFVQSSFVLNIMMRYCRCPRFYQEFPRCILMLSSHDSWWYGCPECPGQGVVQTRTSERRCRSARWMRRLAWPSGGPQDVTSCIPAFRPQSAADFPLEVIIWNVYEKNKYLRNIWNAHVFHATFVRSRFFFVFHSEVAPDDDLCRLRWEPMGRRGFFSHFFLFSPGTTCLNAWMLDT